MDDRTCLKVHFYGGKNAFKTDPLSISLETRRSCEEVLALCSEHLSQSQGQYFLSEKEKTIGPLLLPLFGLYNKDHSLQQWVEDCHVFDSASHDGQEFYFRVKVRLPNVSTFAESVLLGVFLDYLFWQCADDFLRGRVWQLFGIEDNKINSIDAVNFNALHILFASAQYQLFDIVACDPSKVLHTPLSNITKLRNILQKVKMWNFMQCFPDKMSSALQKEYNIKSDPLLRLISCHFLSKYVRQFYNLNSGRSLGELRLMFLDSFLGEYVLSYGLEYFPAENREKPGVRPRPVELIIRPYQDGCSPGLYFNKRRVAPLQDILRVGIQESESSQSDQKCTIHLDIHCQAPLVLLMANRKQAESSISVLKTYYRLKVNYLGSPTDDDQRAPTLRVLNMLCSYGPLEEEQARARLRQRQQEEGQGCDAPQYLIYQDCQHFGLLHVLGLAFGATRFSTYDIRFTPADSDSGFRFTVHEAEQQDVLFEETDPKKVAMFLNEAMMGQRVIPREGEESGAMHFLKEESLEDMYYSAISDDPESHRRKTHNASDVPRLYREEEVAVSENDLIARGRFSEVYRITQMDQERTAILKKVTSTDPAVLEAHRQGAERLTKLRERSRMFLQVYGSLWCSPLRIIQESMPQGKGSLLHRLRDADAPHFTWLHVSSVLSQLASCLDFLGEKGLIYGSFCCAKILIVDEREDTNEDQSRKPIIRIGDPSVAMYLNTLPYTHRLNMERLAWVAPERFQKLQHNTIATEVYAFGTTMWEIVSLGKDPNTCIPGSPADFFLRNNKLPTDFLAPTTVTEDVSHLPGGQSIMRTREWVDAHVLQQQHSDVEEYVTVGAGGDSSSKRAQRDTDGNQETPVKENVPLQQMKTAIVNLIHSCWFCNPSMRPSPREILQKASTVRRLLDDAISVDGCWQSSIFLEGAMRTGNVGDQEKAQQQRRLLQANMHVAQNGQQSEKQARMEKLQEDVRRNILCTIMASRLNFNFPEGKELGKGHFGRVVKAQLLEESETREAEEGCSRELVAVKMITRDNPEEVSQFLKEALCIYKLNHPNVVKLIGFVVKGQNNPYQLVMEYADMGSLDVYVHKNASRLGTPRFKLLLKKFATDVAKGMQYICQEVNRVHADLAARNVVLFSADGQGASPLLAKLCDFGLSHQLTKGYYDLHKSESKPNALPHCLMPVEILNSMKNFEVKFTVESDVWSFGILLWEIFSNRKPEEVLGSVFYNILKKYRAEKYPLTCPDNCSAPMYDIMKACWERVPERRPRFDKLVKSLEELTDHDMEL
ncbi:uncharacterized protein LOC143297463 isoform X2 [Babylonia areolata]